ncbi:hypothetical protein [[Kitasatospora] papulosa]
MTQSDAVRLAVEFLAHGWQSAWDDGAVPDGTRPHLMRMSVQKQPPQKAPDQRV